MVERVDFAAGKPIRGDLGEGKLVEDLQPMQGPFRDGLPLLTPLMDIRWPLRFSSSRPEPLIEAARNSQQRGVVAASGESCNGVSNAA